MNQDVMQIRRAALYERVSTREQEEGGTIGSQADENEKYCREVGYHIVQHYQDAGWSGAKLARPALDQLLNDAKAKLFEVVICHAIDRLARDATHFAMIIRELEKSGIKIEFVKMHFEDDPIGQCVRGILSNIAALERLTILERTRRGKRYKFEGRKQYIGGIPSYGYRYILKNKNLDEPGHLEIDENESKIVKKIFNWVANENLSGREVVRRLTEIGVPTRKHLLAWSRSTVLRILKNENYVGVFYYNRRECVETDKHRADEDYRQNIKTGRKLRPQSEWLQLIFPELRLIEDHVFLAAKEKLRQNLAFSLRNAKQNYLLSGALLKCAACGSSYYGSTMHGKPFYRDGNKNKRFPFPKNCGSPMISAKKIEQVVWNVIAKLLNNKKFLSTQFEKNKEILTENNHERIDDLKLIEKQVATFASEEERLINGYQRGVLTDEQVREPLNKVRLDKARILGKQAALQSQSEAVNKQSASMIGIQSFCDLIAKRLPELLFVEKQEIIRLLVKEIVFDGQRVVIKGFMPVFPEKNVNNENIANIMSANYVLRQPRS